MDKADLMRYLTSSVLPADFAQRMQRIKMKDPNLYERVVLPMVKSKMNKSTMSSSKPELVSEAATSKVYDVWGETGEDLIDSAHPGKMHTEVSGRKDDEGNLVETVVEQQEADLEVAHAVPKGTYAMLVGLHEKLSKLGYVDLLPELDAVISIVATPEDIVRYTLITLANKLDAKGMLEAADKVDALIKKVAVEPAPLVPENERPVWDPNLKKYVVPQKKSVPTKQYEGGLEDPSTQMSYPTVTTTTPTAPQVSSKPLARGGTKQVQTWQEKFNAAHKGNPFWLKEDGLWGPQTQKAYEVTRGMTVKPSAEQMGPVAPSSTKEDKELTESNRLDKKLPTTQYAPPMVPLPSGTVLPPTPPPMPPSGAVMGR